ncbi:MAG: NfeD family protein [Elainellaceae cyanobacterium]
MVVSLTVWFWLIVGIVLCIMEVTIPTAFVEFVMGLSAIAVALIALALPNFGLQVAIWMVLSLLLTLVSRRFVPKAGRSLVESATDATTLTAIAPGQVGRVLYEGCSWQARCDDEAEAIAADETVLVVSRRGNTLLVMPERMVRHL